ncbi:nucleotide pyrophosphohydrolase [Fulvivirga maritima]|uniref:nucleotide pyrophosphohydrolase n=1 Tax=Fulvivirga maritima TaxID=2904247 RepID=UPI001F41A679|nr:nucleotide pyrophosphohydrolase [Fulvivirga maritima]UII29103.1 nucleotide pyrophosphohydrolase [Fulvivirga maritima]
MSEIQNLIDKLIEFRDARDWQQFHDSKNLASAISIEASELNELYLWKNDIKEIESIDKERLAEELADILSFALLLVEKNKLDVTEIVLNKIKKNNEKYPVSKAKGTAKKYNEL